MLAQVILNSLVIAASLLVAFSGIFCWAAVVLSSRISRDEEAAELRAHLETLP